MAGGGRGGPGRDSGPAGGRAPPRPGKIVCVGRNYAAHAAELGHDVPSEPLIFLKPPSSVIGSGDEVLLPPDVGRIDYEGEIGLIVARTCRRVPETDAWGFIGGVVAVNDVSARDLQRRDSQWTRAKGLDTFCPVGNVVDAAGVSPDDISVETRVNGEVRQQAHVERMVFGLAHLVEYISHVMTLEPGDLVATGTPDGVGPLTPGDVVEVALSCGSSVRNPVAGGEALAPAS